MPSTRQMQACAHHGKDRRIQRTAALASKVLHIPAGRSCFRSPWSECSVLVLALPFIYGLVMHFIYSFVALASWAYGAQPLTPAVVTTPEKHLQPNNRPSALTEPMRIGLELWSKGRVTSFSALVRDRAGFSKWEQKPGMKLCQHPNLD